MSAAVAPGPATGPLISVVLPAYRTPRRYLRAAIASVRRQTYPHWELCIVDDGSGQPSLRRTIGGYARRDGRIKADFLPRNGGISAASNRALEFCDGELVAFLDHDDVLAPSALQRVAEEFGRRELDAVYTDQDKISPRGRHSDPFHKPDWSPAHVLGVMYVGHLLVVRRALVEETGGFDPEFDGIQDFELLLRISERSERIGHVDEILYHWRAIPGSIAAGEGQKAGIEELQAKAVNAHLARLGAAARARPHPSLPHRLRLAPDPDPAPPRVSLLIASTEGGRAERLLEQTEYPNLEPVVIEAAELATGRARALNRAAGAAGGEYLLISADTVEPAGPDWIQRLLLYARLPGVGAAGPLLLRPDGHVAAAGLALGLEDPALPVLEGRSADGDGYYGSLPCPREVSAVSGDCMLVSRAAFERGGGFDEVYESGYEDVDLCQRLIAQGLRVVYAPEPAMVDHRRTASRQAAFDVLDRALFVDLWYDELTRGDPYYNANFSPEDANYSPPRANGSRDWDRHARPLR